MAKFTTTIGDYCEGVCGYREPIGGSDVKAAIEKARPLLFNFEYPSYTSEQKARTETNIIKHYWNREIGFETFGLFKLKLDARLNEIMPRYVKLFESADIEFEPLDNVDYTETRNSTETGTNANTTKGQQSENTKVSGKDTSRYSDTPQGSLSDIESGAYLTNATINDNSGTQSRQTNVDNDSSGNYNTSRGEIIHVKGKQSGELFAEAMEKYRNTLMNIDMMIIRDIADLFMGIWEPAGGATYIS